MSTRAYATFGASLALAAGTVYAVNTYQARQRERMRGGGGQNAAHLDANEAEYARQRELERSLRREVG